MQNILDKLVLDGGFTSIFRTIGIIGDSLSSGEHESLMDYEVINEIGHNTKYDFGYVGYHDFYEYSWGQYVARKCGSKVYNFSCGGLTAKEFNEDYSVKHDVFSKNKICQAYMIALGVNDTSRILNNVLEFGSISDIDFENYNNNKNTFIGQYAKIIQRIKELQPKARIFLVNLPKTYNDSEERVEWYDKLSNFFSDISKRFEFTYVVDLRSNLSYTEELRDIYFTGGHLNSLGYKFTADVISSLVHYIIKDNYKDFKQVAFIGTGFYNKKDKW